MLHARRHKQEIAGFEWHDPLSHLEPARAADHHIAFIPAMRLLQIFMFRHIQFDLKFTAQQPDMEPLAVLARNVLRISCGCSRTASFALLMLSSAIPKQNLQPDSILKVVEIDFRHLQAG